MIFDGPVDAIWIENMNTVLDDNKKLCLVSGEIIAMSERMNLIFEPMDLAVASPATVSRCGMVYMEPSQLGWQPLMSSWLARLPPSLLAHAPHRKLLEDLFLWLLEPCLWFVRKCCRAPVPTSDILLANSLMRLLDAHLDAWRDTGDKDDKNYVPKPPPDAKKGGELLQGLFVFCLIWCVGATVDDAGRAKFDAFLRALLKREAPGTEGALAVLAVPGAPQPVAPDPKDLKLARPLPEKGTVFDVMWTGKDWVEWMGTQPHYKVPKGARFHDIFVPTFETVQTAYLADVLLQHSIPILVAGNTGTGKVRLRLRLRLRPKG